MFSYHQKRNKTLTPALHSKNSPLSFQGPQKLFSWLCVEAGTGPLLVRLSVPDNSCAILYDDDNNVVGSTINKVI